jgi:predicted aldo/keto reductase-like oxidoreductase
MKDRIRNWNSAMQYRCFGKTNRTLSVITLGGMRYVHGWEEPHDQAPDDMVEQCARITRLALDAGINHIETARGYGKSERCYGKVLNEVLKIPRDRYHLMTKGAPETAEEARQMVEDQLRALRTDRIDLYAWHGINTLDLCRLATAKGGPVEELLKMKAEGLIGDVGFSTHGPLDAICEAIASGLFSFVNLHFYYFFQRNQAAVQLAALRDMGVFIISPNDKGGQLFNAPPLLKRLCAPLTPIQWNARWCLRTPDVHTLSFGMNEPAHVEEARGVCPVSVPLGEAELRTQLALDARLTEDPAASWEGWEMRDDPSGINIPEVLRFRRLWKCYDMEDFCVYRYNMLQSKGHWFPGEYATDEAVARVDASKAPPGIDVKAMLAETHRRFWRPKT